MVQLSRRKFLRIRGLNGLDRLFNNGRIKFQKEKRMEVHKIVFSPYMSALCKNLSSILPGDLNKTFV